MVQKIRKKIIILGGGFGGLNAAKALAHASYDILLIDKTNHHLFQPLLYQVATAALSPGNIAAPIREILMDQGNTQVIMAEVTQIDPKAQIIYVADGAFYSYDYLIVALGASHSYFGNPQWEPHAPGLKTIVDALQIRERILMAFEEAERCACSLKAFDYLRFVLVGGGPTGVEMAGSIAEIARKTLFNNFRNIKPEQSEIFLIEGESHILTSYPQKLSERALHDLQHMGVKVLLNTRVTEINSEGVFLSNGQFLPTFNVIWAAGNQASPILKSLGVSLDRQGRVLVSPDLSIPEYPNVYVIGDAACVKNSAGDFLPAIAPVAIQQARHVAKSILSQKSKIFHYLDKGSMATIGRAKAIAVVGQYQFQGFIAWLAWCMIHILYLISFRNRLLVMLQWIFWYITGKRTARLITHSLGKNSAHKNELDLD